MEKHGFRGRESDFGQWVWVGERFQRVYMVFWWFCKKIKIWVMWHLRDTFWGGKGRLPIKVVGRRTCWEKRSSTFGGTVGAPISYKVHFWGGHDYLGKCNV